MSETTTQPTSPAPAPPQQGSHHWVMTLELPGRATVTDSNTWTPAPGSTRYDAFVGIRKALTDKHPELINAVCVFFSLERNTL
ncbi:hypothetical protein GPZ77_34500 (plasmid) [Streptomyces sp. QHH-9511]|uniref:hypothetical protein n=1 Tax=Streptomyces sp. QHH-9511 TaxID=2684468 RepID=UPI0013198C41|nr:hypothetical protein [Streptomyces sp. QHH-9511]QGZ53343.1 hypothetical protein GPZ77_34500 [Streptomyces sp. QHH-9511]